MSSEREEEQTREALAALLERVQGERSRLQSEKTALENRLAREEKRCEETSYEEAGVNPEQYYRESKESKEDADGVEEPGIAHLSRDLASLQSLLHDNRERRIETDMASRKKM